jgi:hypothetical protein
MNCMADADIHGPSAPARWDGRRVLFEMGHDGKQVACAISPDAVRELTARRCFKPRDVLASFASARGQIEEIARGKLRRRATPSPMPLTVWMDDVEDHLAASGPAEGPKP